jgi:hypothetical protein
METLVIDSSRETRTWQVLEDLYMPALYKVAKFVKHNGGSLEDAKDILHDALLVLYNDMERGKEINSGVQYVAGVAANMWRAKLKGEGKISGFPDERFVVKNQPEPTVNESKLLMLLKHAGSRCMEMLSAFYFSERPVRTVMTRFGFASEHSASVQKYKCIEKIRETIRTKSIAYEDLFE